jgi:hypothetical protein
MALFFADPMPLLPKKAFRSQEKALKRSKRVFSGLRSALRVAPL